MNRVLRSGEVATETDVNVETLRYYERRGLLDEPQRLPSGQRQYTSETVRRVRAIKQAQSLGSRRRRRRRAGPSHHPRSCT